MAGVTGLEPATSGVTGRHSNQLSYAPAGAACENITVVGSVKRGSEASQAERRSITSAANPSMGGDPDVQGDGGGR